MVTRHCFFRVFATRSSEAAAGVLADVGKGRGFTASGRFAANSSFLAGPCRCRLTLVRHTPRRCPAALPLCLPSARDPRFAAPVPSRAAPRPSSGPAVLSLLFALTPAAALHSLAAVAASFFFRESSILPFGGGFCVLAVGKSPEMGFFFSASAGKPYSSTDFVYSRGWR